MSVQKTSKGNWCVRTENWSTSMTCSFISAAPAPGYKGMLPLRPNCEVMKPPKKIVSSATWTA